MSRTLVIAFALLLCACPSEPRSADDGAGSRGREGAGEDMGRTGGAADTSVAAPMEAGREDAATESAGPVEAGPDADAPPSGEVTARSDARALDGLLGLPAASGDGMHVAYLVGDEGEGPVHLRITRLDGSVLVDRQLVGRRRRADAEPGERRAGGRRARVEAARRELERARMRAMTPLLIALEARAGATTGVFVHEGRLSLRLPDHEEETHALSELEREVPVCAGSRARGAEPCGEVACRVPQRIDGAWADLEGGLVVLRLIPAWSTSCARPLSAAGLPDEEWRVFALAASP